MSALSVGQRALDLLRAAKAATTEEIEDAIREALDLNDFAAADAWINFLRAMDALDFHPSEPLQAEG